MPQRDQQAASPLHYNRGVASPQRQRAPKREGGDRTPGIDSPQRSRWFSIIAAACIVIATLIAYAPAMRAGFIWDDDDYITANSTLQSLGGLREIWFHPGAVPQYYPLVHTMFWIEHHLWGDDPTGYHIINIVLHATAAVLLGVTLRRLRISLPIAWTAAAVFALHPVHVESVAWVTERKNVLSTVFYLLALLAYLRFDPLDSTATPPPIRNKGWYAAAVGLFVCALLSKTVTCSLPAAILLLTWWKRGRLRWDDIAPTLPMFVLGAAGGALTAWMEKNHVGAVGSDWNYSIVERILIAGHVVWFYAGNLIWPSKLIFIYERWTIDASQWQQYLYPIAAAALIVVLFLLRRRIGRGPLTAILFFGGTLFPALGFFDVYPFRFSFVADHFQYLASIGLIVLVTAAAGAAPRRSNVGRPIAATMMLGILITLGILTWQQTRIYANPRTLWEDTIAKNPRAFIAHFNLGNMAVAAQEYDAALQHFVDAAAAKPDLAPALNNIGVELARKNRDPEALEYFQRALKSNPEYIRAMRGEDDARVDKVFVDALHGLGTAYGRLGNIDAAVEILSTAVKWSPANHPAFVRPRIDLALALFLQHRPDDARAQLEEVLRIDPGNPDARRMLANLGAVATQPASRP